MRCKPNSAFSGSIAAIAAAARFIPSGVTSAARMAAKPTPLVIERAEGAHVFDIDGNKYIDFVMGFGPLLLGHTPPAVTKAVQRQLQKGFLYGSAHSNEAVLARRLIDILPCAEKVIFSNTGSEAVHIAIRLARAFTKRRIVVKFEGQYHGWFDPVCYGTPGQVPLVAAAESPRVHMQATAGIPPANTDMIILPWNNSAAIDALFENHGGEIAAVIMEGIPQAGAIAPNSDYIMHMREVTRTHGALMIMDEVITGFRMGLGGIHGALGVKPDLCVLGKALGAGFAISAVAGRDEVLSLTGRKTMPHMGTFNGHALHVSAALAALACYSEPDFYPHLHSRSERFARQLQGIVDEAGLTLKVSQAGALISILGLPADSPLTNYTDLHAGNPATVADFAEALIRHGVNIQARGTLMPASVHDDAVLDESLTRIRQACASLTT